MNWLLCRAWRCSERCPGTFAHAGWNEMRASRSVFVRVPAKTTTLPNFHFSLEENVVSCIQNWFKRKRTKATQRPLTPFTSPSRHPPPSSLPTFLPRLPVCVLSFVLSLFPVHPSTTATISNGFSPSLWMRSRMANAGSKYARSFSIRSPVPHETAPVAVDSTSRWEVPQTIFQVILSLVKRRCQCAVAKYGWVLIVVWSIFFLGPQQLSWEELSLSAIQQLSWAISGLRRIQEKLYRWRPTDFCSFYRNCSSFRPICAVIPTFVLWVQRSFSPSNSFPRLIFSPISAPSVLETCLLRASTLPPLCVRSEMFFFALLSCGHPPRTVKVCRFSAILVIHTQTTRYKFGSPQWVHDDPYVLTGTTGEKSLSSCPCHRLLDVEWFGLTDKRTPRSGVELPKLTS